MSEPSTSPLESQAPDAQLWRHWRQGERIDVGDFLSGFADLDATTVVAVLLIDQRERWQLGKRIPAESYLRRFPSLEADSEAVVELASQIELHQALDAPSVSSAEASTTPEQGAPGMAGAPVVPGYEILEILGWGGMGISNKMGPAADVYSLGAI